ncbi:MAG: AAA family ATPase [Anaerolineae bacterium]
MEGGTNLSREPVRVRPQDRSARQNSRGRRLERGEGAGGTDVYGQPFVGRQRELAELWAHWEQALAWHGRVCFVTGQAGSGKTALIRYFLQQASAFEPKLAIAAGTCNAQTGIGDPYLPFREALAMLTAEQPAQPAAGALSPKNRSQLRTIVVRSALVLIETAPYLAGTFVPGGKLFGALGKAVASEVGWTDRLDELAKQQASASGADAVVDQDRIIEEYTTFVQQLSKAMPLILFLDDLQWADQASLNLLFHLGRHLENYPVLILGAFRPDDVALGRNGERHPLEPVVNELTRYFGDVTIDLDALSEASRRQFVAALLDAAPNCLSAGFHEALFQQTNGQALFTVELLQAMKEQDDLIRDEDGCWVESSALDWDILPARVEGVIEERIARLDQGLRDILTVASIEGEEFKAEVVAQVRNHSELETLRRLGGELERKHRLVNAYGTAQFGSLRVSLFRFWHSLFQQYLYDSLDEIERSYLHRDVGEVLEALFEDQTQEVAAQLARHFEQAGIASKAAAYRLQAGKRAHALSAHPEAAAHLARGLKLLEGVPAGPERSQLELGLQTALGTTRIATHGYASPEVERAYARAREICRDLGDPPQVIPVRYGLCLFRLVRAELEIAQEEGQQLLLAAQQAGNDGYVLGCQVQLGVSALYRGQFPEARRQLEQAAAQYSPRRHAELAHRHGQDPGVTALSYLSWVLWVQGYIDQAREKAKAAVALAEEVDHPYSLGLARAFRAKLHELLHEWPQCQAHAEAALQVANVGRFSLWQAMARMLLGTAQVHQGHLDQGIAELSEGLVELETTGTQLAVPYFRARLAEAYLLAGKRQAGLRAVKESMHRTEQTWWLPEQYRLQAELLLLAPDSEAQAEASLRRALETAKDQGSKMLELRAATSLARLLQKQDRPAAGRQRLADCYSWFTEGLDTADLQQASRLLADLGPAA